MQNSADNLFDQRRAGVLLHITSLPGRFDGGVLGADALKFVDFLRDGGFTIWQTLPVGPVDPSLSPYSMRSADAGNLRLIDPGAYAGEAWGPSAAEVDAAGDWTERAGLLTRTAARFEERASQSERQRFRAFARSESAWLEPYALFEALKARFQDRPWWDWPRGIRLREPEALLEVRIEEEKRIREAMFGQFLFAEQWRALKRYAHARGIFLFGDMPVYVDADSVEAWWRPELFQLDPEGRPRVVSGVPPDYFAQDGQLWGHPIYDWERMSRDGYRWWVDRIRRQLKRFDLLRIDHFRAFESYWEVPAAAVSAREGRWVPGPGGGLLEALAAESMTSRLIAEDLGVITPSVRQLRDQFGLPGMLILQFAFDGSEDNPFLPEHHRHHAVVYPGTHDNDTLEGWYRSLAPDVQQQVCERLQAGGDLVPDRMIDAAFQSPARLAIVQLQDLLGLGSQCRMNTPGTTEGNWRWRFRWEELPLGIEAQCRARIDRSARLVSGQGTTDIFQQSSDKVPNPGGGADRMGLH